jgi:hypothetical protein
MDAKELAAKIHGIEYPGRFSKDLLAQAKADGLVIVYGASDDLMEFEGALYDEIGAYDGGKAYLNGKGLLENECGNDECPHFKRIREKAVTIEAMWCERDGVSWTYKTAIPHETFDILEDGDLYCRGIVFAMADLAALAAEAPQ